ncbi:hypothetical protein [Nocardioides sp.]|uniref:hypothetical protein n=1 Tax=Nocardioides sp. TaxID=35761 RepID=UPI003511C600
MHHDPVLRDPLPADAPAARPSRLLALSVALHLALIAGLTRVVAGGRRGGRDDRGDVPGWVLVTAMSAGLVVAIGQVAEDELRALLQRVLRQVT